MWAPPLTATVQFHTYNPSGILFYQINSVMTDFLGVKLHGGLPWLIFDVGSGPAVVGSNSTRTFNDGQWHTVLQSRPQALHSSWNVVLGVISAAASLPRPYGGAYSHSPIPQLEQGVGMGHLSPTQTGNPGSITEIECTLLSGSAEQDALTMKESPLKNLILATPLMGVVAK
eukprot:Em0056g13a